MSYLLYLKSMPPKYRFWRDFHVTTKFEVHKKPDIYNVYVPINVESYISKVLSKVKILSIV